MFKSKPSLIASAVLLSLGLSACGGSSSSDKKVVETPNSAPTAVTLSANAVSENAIAAEVGSLTTADTAGDKHTYTVSDERFEVVGDMLKLKADTALDFEAAAEVVLTVTATDNGGLSKAQEFTLSVTDVVDTYKFASKVMTGESSVSYGGQIARQILIVQLNNYISSGLAADYTSGKFTSKADVVTKLMSLYAGSAQAWEDGDVDSALTFDLALPTKQTTIGEISSSHKNLQGKIAGRDLKGQTNNWETDLVGWNDKGSISPDGLVQEFFSMIGDNVQADIDGTARVDVNGAAITKFYITDNGLDLKQLTQKFLLGAVNFSQGADDYLDNNYDGKGLLSDNMGGDKDGTKAYTALEHSFDEGFGYFGAARNYNDYTDLEIRAKSGRDGWSKGYNDLNGDGVIDLTSEFNFGNSTNAAKRDVGSAGNANATDLTKEAFDAFLAGRTIINEAVGDNFTAEQKTALEAQSALAVKAWEKAISATIVHYINEVINDDLATIGTDGFNYSNLAKHWSELKGFSLNLQFNPNSPVTAEQFAKLQQLIGMQPALVAADVPAYQAKLEEARAILATAYSFDADNVANW